MVDNIILESKDKTKKICFIITPIGDVDSPTRKRVNQWMEHIYEKALGDEFEIIRADKISSPGIITEQILDLIINADLVIIDYTELNPNVMYEAAIRHIARKPFIQIYPHTLHLPFDIKDLRGIPYDPDNLQYPSMLVEDIVKSYNAIQKSDYKVPEILPLKFDLERIVSEPEKFVDILKKHLPLTVTNRNRLLEYQENISEVYEQPWMQELRSAATGIYSKKVKCPKCGVLQTFNKTAWSTEEMMGMSKHYLCNNCGTEFSD